MTPAIPEIEDVLSDLDGLVSRIEGTGHVMVALVNSGCDVHTEAGIEHEAFELLWQSQDLRKLFDRLCAVHQAEVVAAKAKAA
jgi:hypothetical protein